MRPYYHLAMRVLARAVLDVMDPTGSADDRESARAFLTGSVMLQHWCRVAALDPDYVAESMETFTAGLTMMVPRMPKPDESANGRSVIRPWEPSGLVLTG